MFMFRTETPSWLNHSGLLPTYLYVLLLLLSLFLSVLPPLCMLLLPQFLSVLPPLYICAVAAFLISEWAAGPLCVLLRLPRFLSVLSPLYVLLLPSPQFLSVLLSPLCAAAAIVSISECDAASTVCAAAAA